MKLLLLAMVAVLVLGTVNAQYLGGTFCSNLYSSNGPTGEPSAISNLRVTSTYTSILDISLLIVLMVLMVLGIVYALGVAFKFDKFVTFVKTEYIESFANLAIIAFISLGIAGLDGIVFGMVQLASAAIPSSVGTATTANNLNGIYVSICNNYVNDVTDQVLNVMYAQGFSFILSGFQSVSLELMPNGFGIILHPYSGLGIIIASLGVYTSFSASLGALEVGVIFFLSFIYFLFPLFMFAGILFRSFPWTRALGGSMIALFIGFYIIFPAILYAFTTVNLSSLFSSNSAISGIYSEAAGSNGLDTFVSVVAAVLGTTVGDVSILFAVYGSSISFAMLQVVGIIIAFMIAFDSVEAFGKLLGAPSTRGSGILRKII